MAPNKTSTKEIPATQQPVKLVYLDDIVTLAYSKKQSVEATAKIQEELVQGGAAIQQPSEPSQPSQQQQQ